MPPGRGKPAINHPQLGVAFLLNMNAFGVSRCSKLQFSAESGFRSLARHLPMTPSLGCSILDGRNSEKMRCHVRRGARRLVCANPKQHVGTVNPASGGRLGGTVGILMRLLEANCLYTLASF